MEKEVLDNYLKSAKIMKQVLEFARSQAKPGASFLQLAEKIEAKIVELGGQPAFPVNLSRNAEAAHYTPFVGDVSFAGEKDVLKIDVGVHVDGYIVDAAFTVDFSGENADLVEATQAALNAAIERVHAGASVREIGREIALEIRRRGFEPIQNLAGHSLEQYVLHAGEEIPNVEQGDYVLREGDVFAIEPFATTGKGRVIDTEFLEIYSIEEPKKVRLPASRALLEAASKYELLPFATRWFAKEFDVQSPSFKLALADLTRQKVFHPYHGLREASGGLVSQAETTVIVQENDCKPLTPPLSL